LFAIKEKKSLPPVSQLISARIIIPKNVEPLTPPVTRSRSTSAPPAPTVLVAPPKAALAKIQPINTDNAPSTNQTSDTGFYTISFAQPSVGPQSDEDDAEDSPTLEPMESDDSKMDEDEDQDLLADDDSKMDEDDDQDLLADDDSTDQDEETADELDYEDDDSPIARAEFGAWPSKSIQEVRLDLAEHGAQSPEDRSNRLFDSSRRLGSDVAATNKVFAWAAPNIKYQPLYFEDVALERYGQTKGLVTQPIVSAGRFLADKAFLGARALRVSPKSCDSPLGFCRPGSPTTVNDHCGCESCEEQSCSHANCLLCR